MKRIRALIVDDEPLARDLLRFMLEEEADVEVVGECRNGAEAVEAVRDDPPDLLFLDVQMPELDGFGVVRALEPEGLPTLVFVTAYDRYALRAFEVHALDYLLKPFDEARLAETLRRARERLSRADPDEVGRRVLAMLAEMEPRRRRHVERLVIRSEGRARFLPVAEVDWVEAAGKHVLVHAGKSEHHLRESISRVEEQLDPDAFIRIHRSTLVRIDRIREVQSWFGGDYVVILQDGTKLTSSRGYRGRLQELVGKRV
ncbi:MAG: response regulator [Gemmatimonadetes bacterium]|nr:response regulator [Gemmatimonadota bacterium]